MDTEYVLLALVGVRGLIKSAVMINEAVYMIFLLYTHYMRENVSPPSCFLPYLTKSTSLNGASTPFESS